MVKKFHPGNFVTCLIETEAYYSDYGANKGQKILFKPGMVGTIVNIAPKVTNSKIDDPRFDQKPDFLVVDYLDENQIVQRVGLDQCNAVKVKHYIAFKVIKNQTGECVDTGLISTPNINEVNSMQLAQTLRENVWRVSNDQAMIGHPDWPFTVNSFITTDEKNHSPIDNSPILKLAVSYPK